MNSVLISQDEKQQWQVSFGQIPKLTAANLKKNQLLIKVESCALNPSDILFMRGKYKGKINFPYTPGWEGSGTVVAVGQGSN